MKVFKNHRMAVISSILAMVPITPGCLLGIPFGAWTLTVLTRREVLEAFIVPRRD